jgi:hypothetical protein
MGDRDLKPINNNEKKDGNGKAKIWSESANNIGNEKNCDDGGNLVIEMVPNMMQMMVVVPVSGGDDNGGNDVSGDGNGDNGGGDGNGDNGFGDGNGDNGFGGDGNGAKHDVCLTAFGDPGNGGNGGKGGGNGGKGGGGKKRCVYQ